MIQFIAFVFLITCAGVLFESILPITADFALFLAFAFVGIIYSIYNARKTNKLIHQDDQTVDLLYKVMQKHENSTRNLFIADYAAYYFDGGNSKIKLLSYNLRNGSCSLAYRLNKMVGYKYKIEPSYHDIWDKEAEEIVSVYDGMNMNRSSEPTRRSDRRIGTLYMKYWLFDTFAVMLTVLFIFLLFLVIRE